MSATDIYRWCQRWQSARFGMPERWSIVRVLRRVAEPIGGATTIGIHLPHGKYSGKRLGDQPKDEAEHFMRCPACCGWIDCRDLGQVFEHEGPLPHPAEDQAQ